MNYQIKLTAQNFHKNIIEYYFKNFQKIKYGIDLNLIGLLPDIDKIQYVLTKDFICENDYISIKFILDIYEHMYLAYDGPLYTKLINQYCPTASYFYYMITDDCYRTIREFYKNPSNKELYDIIVYKMKIKLWDNKGETIKHIKTIKSTVSNLINGVSNKKFYK